MKINSKYSHVFLVGTGPMAISYVEILKDISCSFTVIGRGQSSCDNFKKQTNINPHIGGLEKYLLSNSISKSSAFILATGIEVLIELTDLLLKNNFNKILIEKPAALSIEELLLNSNRLSKLSQNLSIAYNRRFYSSVIQAEKMIKEDGGLSSVNFEFTEWTHLLNDHLSHLKENWFFANSTHVVDLVFFMIGKPEKWNCFSNSGTLDWHKNSVFVGSGISKNNIPFSYNANWESPGRWALELLTNKRRIYLKPMEMLKVQEIGSVEVKDYDYDDAIDKKYKPGLFLQLKAFLENDYTRLKSFDEQVYDAKEIYNRIIN